jgi:hypothetical protein
MGAITPTRLGLNETQQQRWVAVKQFLAPNVCVMVFETMIQL